SFSYLSDQTVGVNSRITLSGLIITFMMHTTARQQRWSHCERHTKIFAAQLVEQHLNSKIRKTFAGKVFGGLECLRRIIRGGMEATAIYDDDNTLLAQKYWITK
ncbi:5055_t:CDS:2, partial [Funneliformis caledonium]